jgi:hypothetical protein
MDEPTSHDRRTWGTVSAGAFSPQPTAEPGEEALRQQGHGGVVVPADPAAHLVVVQPQLLCWPFSPSEAESWHSSDRTAK